MSHPHTAIIVLNYNGLDVTKRFLRDLYANTENFHLVMIDNGSTDGSVEFLGDFADSHDNVTLICNDDNLGVIGGRNQGWNIFQSLQDKPPYLVFLDNDQFVHSGWLEHHFKVLEESNADVVGVEAWLLSSSFRPVRQCKRPTEPWSYVGCGGMLMRREIPEKIGMFDPQFNPCYFEDPDFCFRAKEEGFKLAWNNKAKLTHLPHQTLGKNSKRFELFLQSHKKFFKKWTKRAKFRPQRQPQVAALQS